MKTSHKLTLISLLVLAAAAAVGLLLTNDSSRVISLISRRRARASNQEEVVDQRPLATARNLAGEAETRSEHKFAEDAQRVADQEVDLAFAMALQAASQTPKSETPAIKAIEEQIQNFENRVAAGGDKVKQLTAMKAAAKGGHQESLEIQLELTQAELALEQDGLDEAREALIRAGGDPRSKIQRLLEEHEATEHANGTVQMSASSSSTPASEPGRQSLIAMWSKWKSLRAKRAELAAAQQDALNATADLARKHDALEQRVRQEQSQKMDLARQASNHLEVSKAAAGEDSKQMAADALASLRGLSADQTTLANYGKRIEDHQQLSAIYSQWSSLIESRERASLHRIIKSVLWIVLALLLVFLLDRLTDHLFVHFASDRKQLVTLRAVIRFTMQALALLVILVAIFGSPNQMPTILGLAGAGLTVALKDFVVAFFGWFVLIGRNGIHVGDWVEINGVGGEVIELGLLRTILLETGNWNESGHPTGRQVAFVNSFAVEGHYFNFSTSGQWLWDQIQMPMPAGESLYPALERVQAVVKKETERDAKMAEQEWQRVTSRYAVRSFSAAPAVNVKQTSQGVEIAIRYITRASERYDVRSRLNQAVVRELQPQKGITPVTEPVSARPEKGSSPMGSERTPDK